jgi:uncharacterized protein (TIGR03000 family)
MGGCTGCYGCYGGYSCYGIPVPIPEAAKDKFPPINPDAGKKEGDKKDGDKKDAGKKDGAPEEAPAPGEKKNGAKKPQEQVRAKVRIEIPEGGKLFVDGRPINVSPGVRVFQTPALAADEAYFYDIRIEVERNGVLHSEQRRVIIRAGDDVAVNFPSTPPNDPRTAQVIR